MPVGPVEYLIVAFPGNQFNGEIVPALAELIASDTIRLLDLVFIAKDADGNVLGVEFDEHDDLSPFAALEAELHNVITLEDIEYAATDLEPNSSAAVLVWEDLWAAPLVNALRGSGGILVESARIPSDLIEAAIELTAP
jgi:hypothetical protein